MAPNLIRMCDAASLVSAAKSGDASAVRSILRHAASDAHRAALLDHRGEGTADATIGNTPAHWAASAGHVEALRALLEAGASVVALNKGDSMPLASATLGRHRECVRLLLEAGVCESLPSRQIHS